MSPGRKGRNSQKHKIKNKKHNERRKNVKSDKIERITNLNKRYMENLSDHDMTNNQINLLSKGLKFTPTPNIEENRIRRQLLRGFEQFARRTRLKYIFHGQDNKSHPFHVKSNWKRLKQKSRISKTQQISSNL